MPRNWNRRWPVRTAEQRADGQSRWRALAERRALAGLTTRGTKPKRRREQRLLVREIDSLAAALLEDFSFLSEVAQVRILKVAGRLAELRKRLT